MTADKEARDSRQGDPEVRRPVVFTLLLVLAAKLRDDVPGMKSGVPCFRPAGRRRFVIPRDAFIRFYTAPK